LTYTARNKPWLGEGTNPQSNVKALFDQVKTAIGEQKFNADARMCIEKSRHDRSNVPPPELGWCSHPQDTV